MTHPNCTIPGPHAAHPVPNNHGPHASSVACDGRPEAGVRTPWAQPVPNDVLAAGLRAVAADAVAREDWHTAGMAYTVLAGDYLGESRLVLPDTKYDPEGLAAEMAGAWQPIITTFPDSGLEPTLRRLIDEHGTYDVAAALLSDPGRLAAVAGPFWAQVPAGIYAKCHRCGRVTSYADADGPTCLGGCNDRPDHH